MPLRTIKPYWSSNDGERLRVYQGDTRAILPLLPEHSVQCVVTSPPYWGIRSYLDKDHPKKSLEIGREKKAESFIETMVEVGRGLKRVLRKDGTFWLNLGDNYSGGKSLNGIPWRVALALKEDGWILRQDIIWHKPCPMPESVDNRCTKSHEYIFLLTQSPDYYYDSFSIREKGTWPEVSEEEYEIMKNRAKNTRWYPSGEEGSTDHFQNGKKQNNPHHSGVGYNYSPPGGRNKRDVWTIAPNIGGGYSGAHFATYPPELILPCILAGTSEYGACSKCGAPWNRILEKNYPEVWDRKKGVANWKRTNTEGKNQYTSFQKTENNYRIPTAKGWEPSCTCSQAGIRPCVVLDPFLGTGTTAIAALEKGRRCWGIELSEEYIHNHIKKRVLGLVTSIPRLNGLFVEKRKIVEIGKRIG